MQRDNRRGLILVGAGILLVLTSFGGAWSMAPDRAVSPAEAGVTAEDSADTPVLVGVQGPGPRGSVTMLASNGSVEWQYVGGVDGPTISYQNVQLLDDGRVLTSFADGEYEDCTPFEPPCKRTGVRILEPDPRPEVVAEWSYAVRTRKDSEVHDAEMLPSGDVLVTDMEYESIFVVNVTTGDRGWTWNASEYYDAPPDPTREDWLHINDADRIAEGRYLVSVRNENQLLVVERGEGVVEVVNEDGDPAVLNKQHNPQWLRDGRVLVADSDNDRVVELYRDEATGEWRVAWAVYRAGGMALDWPRDADRLPNGHTVVTDSRNDRVVVVDENGSLVRSYATPPLPYEADAVPYGEQPTSGDLPVVGNADAVDGIGTRVPVLSLLLASARHTVPVPYWVSEIHVVTVAVTLALWGWGSWLLASESAA